MERMEITKPASGRNVVETAGAGLVRSGLSEVVSGRSGIQRVLGVTMMGGGALVYGYGKFQGLVRPRVQRVAVSTSRKLAEMEVISEKAVGPIAVGLTILGTAALTSMLMPTAAMAADDVIEASLNALESFFN